MKGYKIPIYKTGTLLTWEMMNSMKEFVIDLASYPYIGYSDGIICGADLKISKGILSVNKGMFKYKDAIFFLPDGMIVPLRPINEWQVVKMVISDKETDAEYERMDMDIVADTDLTTKENQIEICRLRLQNGANLRSNYRNFLDLETEYDTLNIIEAKWSSFGMNGIHPQILYEFVKETAKLDMFEPSDICFILQIQNMQGRTCQRNMIESYLNIRLGKKKDTYNNMEIYQGLKSVLKLIKEGKGIKTSQRVERRILVD